jgi:hypothetical protein
VNCVIGIPTTGREVFRLLLVRAVASLLVPCRDAALETTLDVKPW